jgi:hypothetical protein
MIQTVEIGQPTICVGNKEAARLRKRLCKPRVTYLWKGDVQTLYVKVPHDISDEYVQGFSEAKFLHFTLSEHTGQNLQQPFCLAIFDRADRLPFVGGIRFLNCGEPLLIGVTVYDWTEPIVPQPTHQRQQGEGCIFLPDGTERLVPLFVGGWE